MAPHPDHSQADPHAFASVYELIRSRVLREEIPPNARINIDALARELEVSSTPVREALRQLQGDNLVVQGPGRGYRTTPILNAAELRELFEFRLLVEPWAAKIAATDRLQNPGYVLEREIADITDLIGRQADIRYELMDHDIRFHDAILSSTGNEVLRTAYSQTHCHLHAFRLHPGERTGQYTVAEHRVIHEAIRSREPEAAEQAMRDHLTAAYLRFEVAHGVNSGAPYLPGAHQDRPAPTTSLAL